MKDGLTTVHETSVIGTYINGKYAQVLQSSSRILTTPAAPVAEGKIRPSNTQRILKTIGPQHGKLKPQLEPTPTHQYQDESSLPLEVLFNASSGEYFICKIKTRNTVVFFKSKCDKFVEKKNIYIIFLRYKCCYQVR